MKKELGLELRGLTTGYRERRGQEQRISEGLDLSIAPGELVLFMGPNGSGKSTLMHCLAGLDSVTSGEIMLDGGMVSSMSQRRRWQARSPSRAKRSRGARSPRPPAS